MDYRPLAILCDLDGTLCLNDQGRNPFEYREARHDAVNEPVAEILRKFFDDGAHSTEIIFISAREEYGRQTAIDWLTHHLPWTQWRPIQLFMRTNKDFRKDAVIKEEIYREKIEPFYDVLFILDDRQQVVNMWRGIGLPCLQVAEGAF